MAEEWREIPGTLYSVSSEGRVVSHHPRWRGGRLMQPQLDSGGYLSLTTWTSAGQHSRKVHHLVAEAFLGSKPTPKHEINHIDGVRTNNRVENLEWVTRSGNMRHRFDVLKSGMVRGENHRSAKLTEMQVREIRARIAGGEAKRAVAAVYGVTRQNVNQIAIGKSWAWLV